METYPSEPESQFSLPDFHSVMNGSSFESSKMSAAPNKGKSLSFYRKLPLSTVSLMNKKKKILPFRTS